MCFSIKILDMGQKTYFTVILVAVLFKFGGTRYTMTEKTMTYEEANRTCRLATPEKNSFADEYIIDLGSLLKNASGSFWVGYTHHSAVFQYIGCSSEEDVSGVSTHHFSTPPDPGLCHSECAENIFGLKNSLCYCFDTQPEVEDTEPYCNKTCWDFDIRCGGKDPAVVSTFSVTSVTLNDIVGDYGNDAFICVALDIKTNRFIWKDCETKLSTRCQTKEGIPTTNDDTRGNWAESASSCFSKKRYPLSKTLNQSVKLNDKMPEQPETLWTGLFRSNYVIRTSRGMYVLTNNVFLGVVNTECFNVAQNPGTPVEFGCAKVEHGNMKATLKFGDRLCGDENKAICEEDDEETTTVTSETATSHRTTRPVTSTKLIPTVLLYVGIPAAVVFIIVVVVGVILCCKKRRSRKEFSTRAPEIAQQYSQVQDSYDDTQNVYQEPFDKVTDSPDNARIPLQEHKSQPNDDDDAYDVTGAASAARTDAKPSDNIYNKLNDVDNDTYDHTGDVKKNYSENEYASAVTAASKDGDDNYDVSGVHKAPGKAGMVLVENTYDRVDGAEGSYSQVNKSFKNTGPTDNVYN